MENGEIITFDAKKNFTYVRKLGSGGTGDTHLFKDETTDMLFAIKKYVPKDAQYIDDHYNRFVDEIKILFNISHPNIVRIFNYYLYPALKTGFLQMEYVDGITIDKFQPDPWDEKNWETAFHQVVEAFSYLEKNQILHRDIRPANIMLDKNFNVKIIDFGFGKQISCNEPEKNSVFLNWPATDMPNEVVIKGEYNVQTEIYFVGTLFRHLLKDEIEYYNFQHIIEKMIKIDPQERYTSFSEIINDISAGVLAEIEFSDEDKETYRSFSSQLSSVIAEFVDAYTPINDMQIVLARLSDVIRNSSLEEYVPNNSKLIDCFVSGRYNYYPNTNIDVKTVVDFYKLIMCLSSSKKKVVLDNINNRLSAIKIKYDDDLPF